MSQTYYNHATGQYEPWTRRMHANRPYREAILSGEFRPSAYALQVDQILDEARDATKDNKEAHPEYWTWLGTMGWIFTHPLLSYNSMTEHTTWVNRGLGDSFLGAGSSSSNANPEDTNVYGSGQSQSDSAANAAAEAAGNPQNFTEDDVIALYAQYLGRTPGGSSLQYWMDRSRTMTMDELTAAIKNSPEGQTYAETQNTNNQNQMMIDVIGVLFNNTFGRPPTQEEIDKYLAIYGANNNIDEVQAAMDTDAATNSGETEGSNGVQAGADLEAYRSVITGLYNELFGRDPAQAGMDYWLAQLRSGAVTPDNLRDTLIAAAQGSDLEYYTNNVLNGGTTNGGTDNSTDGGSTTNSGGGNNEPRGYYWAYWQGSWQWIPVYEGYEPLAGAVFVEGATPPATPPEGYDANGPINNGGSTDGGSTNAGGTDTGGGTTNTGGGNTNTGGGTTDTGGGTGGGTTGPNDPAPTAPTPPELFTPDKSMFYRGMFTANDMLSRDGGPLTSTFYDNARQEIIDSLAAQALANGRTQNTAQEIQLAQGYTPTYSAGGLFNSSNADIMRSIGFNV